MQPVARITPVSPVPSILTSARNRRDGFGATPLPSGDTAQTPGAASPSTDAWRDGISWNPASCSLTGNWAHCPSADDEKDTGEPLTKVDVSPFWIYASLQCDMTTLASEQRLSEAADAQLEAATAAGIGRALWLGDGYGADDETPTLRNSADNVTVNIGSAMNIEDAFAVLLAEYTECGDVGGAVFHVPPILIPEVLGASDGGKLADRVGDTYQGPLSSVVSPGPGYPQGASLQGADGFGPELVAGSGTYRGNDADEVWVYVTGPVEYALGKPIPASDDRLSSSGFVPRQNTFEALAERQAIVRFDPCCTFAALVQTVPVEVT